MKQLKEKLDFSFSMTDFSIISDMLYEYMLDRVTVFNTMQDMSYDESIIDEYLHFFVSPHIKNKKYHPYIYRLIHFLSRDYEVFNVPTVASLVDILLDCFSSSIEVQSVDVWEQQEYETLQSIYSAWENLYTELSNYPFLMLDSFTYNVIDGVTTYADPNTDKFIRDTFDSFVSKIKPKFPNSLKRIDSFIFCDPSYIEFVAGKGTMAYYINDSVILPCTVKEDDKLFFVETLYHEFMHFIYELLPENIQVIWYDYFDTWIENEVTLTREYDKLDPEELFADVGSFIYGPEHNDFIKEPSQIVVDVWKNLIESGFSQ